MRGKEGERENRKENQWRQREQGLAETRRNKECQEERWRKEEIESENEKGRGRKRKMKGVDRGAKIDSHM